MSIIRRINKLIRYVELTHSGTQRFS